MQKMNKKISEDTKRLWKRLKAMRKHHIDKNKEKKGVLLKAIYFTQCRAYFRPFMHAIVACVRVSF